MVDYEAEYNNQLRFLKNQIDKLNSQIENLQNKINSEDNEELRRIHHNNLLRRKNGLEKIMLEYENMRIGTLENEQEKLQTLNGFLPRFNQEVDPDAKLIFHGSNSLSLVKQIIKSKSIISGEDRTGVATSHDEAGVISITNPKSFEVTFSSYAGLTNKSYLPAGAIFVLKPEEDYDGIELITKNVYFDKEPDRLLGIISTTENQAVLKECLIQNGFDPSLSMTYAEFLDRIHGITATMSF